MPNDVAAYLTAYEPSLRERIGNATYDIARYLGLGNANQLRNDVEGVVDFVPGVGDVVGVDEAVNDFSAGNYGAGAAGLGLAAVGAVPVVGDVAAKVIKSLPSSVSLNIPIAPSLENLSLLSRIEDVPLDMARGSQNKMEWDKFNSGEFGTPMFSGYEDLPVAAKKENGEYIVYDGHHRSVKAINEGKHTIPMYVIDAKNYDPQNAGRSVKTNSYDIDEINSLLSELGL